MAIWAGEAEKEFHSQYSGLHLSWSWGLAIVAVVLELAALVPIIKTQRRDD